MRRIDLRLLIVGCCFPALLLGGCVAVHNVAYQPNAAHPIRTIRVAQYVEMPKKMFFSGLSESLLMGVGAGVGGAVGGALMTSSSTSRENQAEFGVPESVRSAYMAEIRKTGKFSVVTGSSADAEMKLRVIEYGFFQAGFMHRGVKPFIRVQAQLVRGDGTLAWEQTSLVPPKSPLVEPQLPDRMRENPALTAESLRSAVRLAAADAGQTLNR